MILAQDDLFPSQVVARIQAMLGPSGPPVLRSSDDFPDQHHRLSLEFWWQANLPPLIVIGQNPSIATRHRSDPTVTRCARRAYRGGFGGLIMLNMFPYCATHPADLWIAEEDPAMPPRNRDALLLALELFPASPILFAPGNDSHPRHGAMAAEIAALLDSLGRTVLCLGLTETGHPRHPSRAGYDRGMVAWNGKWPTTGKTGSRPSHAP